VIGPSDTVDRHIDDFIHVGRHIWDIGGFAFDGDPIYDIKGSLQLKRKHVLSMERNSLFRPEVVPYLVSSSLGNHKVFFESLVSF